MLVEPGQDLGHALSVWLLGLDPATLVANDILVGQLTDRLNLTHGRVVQNSLLAIWVEHHVQ